jgi:hypothetical protein
MRHGCAVPARYRGCVLKPTPTSSGYQSIKLRGRGRYVHRLMLEAFVGPCPTGHQAAHCDGDRHNNVLTNLRWATRKENEADKLRHGTHQYGARNPAWTGTRCGRGHVYTEANTRRRVDGSRSCRTCARDQQRRRRAAAAIAAAALAHEKGAGTAPAPSWIGR